MRQAEQITGVFRVFEPFFSRKAEGMGLGLALSHRLVTAHGGTIEVRSDAGSGSRFTVVLPLAQSETLGASACSSEKLGKGRDPDGDLDTPAAPTPIPNTEPVLREEKRP